MSCFKLLYHHKSRPLLPGNKEITYKQAHVPHDMQRFVCTQIHHVTFTCNTPFGFFCMAPPARSSLSRHLSASTFLWLIITMLSLKQIHNSRCLVGLSGGLFYLTWADSYQFCTGQLGIYIKNNDWVVYPCSDVEVNYYIPCLLIRRSFTVRTNLYIP